MQTTDGRLVEFPLSRHKRKCLDALQDRVVRYHQRIAPDLVDYGQVYIRKIVYSPSTRLIKFHLSVNLWRCSNNEHTDMSERIRNCCWGFSNLRRSANLRLRSDSGLRRKLTALLRYANMDHCRFWIQTIRHVSKKAFDNTEKIKRELTNE